MVSNESCQLIMGYGEKCLGGPKFFQINPDVSEISYLPQNEFVAWHASSVKTDRPITVD